MELWRFIEILESRLHVQLDQNLLEDKPHLTSFSHKLSADIAACGWLLYYLVVW